MIKSLAQKYKKSFISIFMAFLAAIIILLLSGKNKAEVLSTFFTSTFRSKYYFGTMLNSFSMLLFASLGATVALQSGLMNLGGAGQIFLGAFITAVLLKHENFPVSITFLIVAASTAAIGGLSAILKIKKNINELLSSFLISAAIIPLIDSAIAGPMRNSSGNLIATDFIAVNHRLTQILKPSPLNLSILVSLIVCLAFFFFLKYTKHGKQYSLTGTAYDFAKFSGYNCDSYQTVGMMISAALHGAAGFYCVTGVYYTCHSGFYGGLNWDGITISLIAQNNPLLLIPSSLIISWLYTSCDATALRCNFSFDMNSLVEAVVIMTISANFYLPQFIKRIKSKNDNS